MIFETRLFASVIFAPPVVVMVNIPPWNVVTGILFVKAVEATFAPATTWYFKAFSKSDCGTAAKLAKPVSASKEAKAAFVGAKTVNGELAVPPKIETKFGMSLLVKAATKLVKFGLAKA